VPRALVALGFDLKITKLRIKPGKPFVFATRQRAQKTDIVFGLPGNPVSGFCCTVRLTSRLIERMQGRVPAEPESAELESPLPTNGPREFYQPAIVEGSRVKPLGWKGSADVFTLARSNALIIRPIDDPARAAGDRVSILRF
jgi:molybdopterin molybdotransferase